MEAGELLGHSDFENRNRIEEEEGSNTEVHKEEMASIWSQSSVDVSTIKASHNALLGYLEKRTKKKSRLISSLIWHGKKKAFDATKELQVKWNMHNNMYQNANTLWTNSSFKVFIAQWAQCMKINQKVSFINIFLLRSIRIEFHHIWRFLDFLKSKKRQL